MICKLLAGKYFFTFFNLPLDSDSCFLYIFLIFILRMSYMYTTKFSHTSLIALYDCYCSHITKGCPPKFMSFIIISLPTML